MVVAIEGIITKKEPTFIIIKCQSGISYGIFVSLFSSSKLALNEKQELLITQIIKEDSNKFYGFLDKNEQNMFEMLLKVNGIGASTAMAVCSSLDSNLFFQALSTNDENAFKKIPGIGPKTAKRIITELADSKLKINNTNTNQTQALAALISLGFKEDKIIKVLSTCQNTETSQIIKEALKKLS